MSLTEHGTDVPRLVVRNRIRAEFSYDPQTQVWQWKPLARTASGYHFDADDDLSAPDPAWLRETLLSGRLDAPFSVARPMVDVRGRTHDVVLCGNLTTEGGRQLLQGVVLDVEPVLEDEVTDSPAVVSGPMPALTHRLAELPPGVAIEDLPWKSPAAELPDDVIATLNLCLSSIEPAGLIWGPERVALYNTAMSELLADVHPGLFGRPLPSTWPEGWAQMSAAVEQVFATGRPASLREQQVTLSVDGQEQEGFINRLLAPLRGSDGSVVAVFSSVTEVTDDVQRRRRLSTLHDLAAQGSLEGSRAELFARLARVLGDNLHDLPFTLTYLVEPGRREAVLQAATGITEAAGAAPEVLRLDVEGGWPVTAAIAQHGRTTMVDDVPRLFPGLLAGTGPRQQTHAMLCFAELGDRLPAVLSVIGVNARQQLNAEYQTFLAKVLKQLRADVTALCSAQLDRERTANLQRAMESNRQIGAAIGILMTVHKITEQQAFLLLSKASQQANRKLRDIADDVIVAGALPPDTMPGSRRNRRRPD